MITDIEYNNRQLIPRWLPFNRACLLDYKSIFNNEPENEIEKVNYEIAIQDWEKNRSISFALNIIAMSHTLNIEQDTYYQEAVDFIIDKGLNKNALLLDLLGDADRSVCCTENDSDSIINKEIHDTRLLVREYPNDSLRWMDLAYYYLIAGNSLKAEKLINIALNLSNSNSHIIRSAARFYVFKGDPEKALYIIRNSSSFSNNPLIISSEISISEAFKLKSSAIKAGRKLVIDENISKAQLSELYATLATLELNNGYLKKGKHLLENALYTPNENTLAQVQFLIRKFDGSFDPALFTIPCRYEADAWNYYQKMDFNNALIQARQWFYYQPFSSRPAVLYSYIQSLIFENNKDAIKLLDNAIKLSKDDFSLINNRIVALAQDGNIEKAAQELEKLETFPNIDNGDNGVLLATKGLIEYKKNNYLLGRKYYKEAIDIFKKYRYQSRECIANYYWYREEEKFDKNESDKIYKTTREIAEKYNYTDIKYKLKIE